MVKALREGQRRAVGHTEICGRERDEKQCNDDAEGLDGPQLGQASPGDVLDLPGQHRLDERDVGGEAVEGPEARAADAWEEVVGAEK